MTQPAIDTDVSDGSVASGVGPAHPVVEACGLNAGYGQVDVVRDVDLVVNAGEIVVLLGANGAGKTTTLLSLAGVLRPSGGSINWLGTPARGPLHHRARSGLRFVTEERSIFPSLTTLDNLRLGDGSVDRALELFPELVRLLKRRAGLLSGGEQQILTLARALSSDPRLLLADELSLGLAPMVVQRLLTALQNAAQRGVAVLLVEQQVRQALGIADRGYVMKRGRIVISGDGSDLLSRIGDIEGTYLDSGDLTTTSSGRSTMPTEHPTDPQNTIGRIGDDPDRRRS